MNQPLHAIIIGIDNHADRFDRVHLFEAETGYLCVLKRKSTKKVSSNNLDLFQEIEMVIEKKNEYDIGFVKEFTTLNSHAGIGKNYTSFDNASRFCRVIHLNARHMPHPADVFELLKMSLQAWDVKPHPDVTFFKALYRLAYEDGFPVKEGWLLQLNKTEQQVAKSVLYQKIDEQEPDANAVKLLAENLMNWLTHHQDFLF